MPAAVSAYYDQAVEAEWTRLDTHWLEFETTYHHIVRAVPVTAPVLDIGGGPGRYAFRLAAAGYGVFLADLSARNIDFARAHEAQAGPRLAGMAQMDARDLSRFADGQFGATLCLGPLYHLQDAADRRQVIQELWRVTRPGGLIFAAFILNHAPMYDFIKRAPHTIGQQVANLKRWYATGLYSPPDTSTRFPQAYFAKPSEVAAAFPPEQFEPLFQFGCEGIFNQSEDRLMALEPAARQQWLELGLEFSRSSLAIASSEHVVFVGRRLAG